jgi:acetylornithine deacetylase
MTEIEKLLISLLEIPSPSGQEKAVGDFVIEQLAEFKIEKQFVAPNRFNVVARKGSPKRWLVAHMDTVPGVVPIRHTVSSIFGRGACDTKQSIAASIIVGQKLTDIGLLFTVGEEVDFIGAQYAQKSGISGELVIIQEPTNFSIVTGHRGVITFRLKVSGQAQHSSKPNADNAISKLLPLLQYLEQQNWTAFNLGLISGGSAGNVVANQAEVTIVVRPISPEEHTAIHAELKNIQKEDIEITIINNFPPGRSTLGFPENIALGFSEMAFFANSIEFGAGSSEFAHTDKEHIDRSDLNQLPEKLISLLENTKI